MTERDFIATLRRLASNPGARGLLDDAAILEVGGATLVLTHDMIVEGIHFLPDDPPGDVAWKLLAVNLSDLAAKGARPIAALLGYSLGEDKWDQAFAAGLGEAMTGFGIDLLGGDTVAMPAGAPRAFGLTAIGEARGPVPSRSGASAGDQLWVSGSIGDSGAGLRILKGEAHGSAALIERYRNLRPRLEAGERLAPLVSAMMDVSDGLLIDAGRMAEASNVEILVDLASLPLSPAFLEALGDGREARLFAATCGDDYELLFTAAPEQAVELLALADELGLPLNAIGRVETGKGLRLSDGGQAIALPERVGWEHR